MNFNYTLKYQTFDSLFESVRVDMKTYSLEGKIEPQQLIKVALRCNYDLGLRINMVKNTVLDIVNGKARLPEDFRVMNFALLCGSFTETFIPGQGTNIQEVPIKNIIPTYQDPIEPNPCTDVVIDACTPTLTPNTTIPICLTRCTDSCGKNTTGFQLVQVINTISRSYNMMYPIRFKNSHDINCECPNLNWMCRDEAFIKNGFIWFNDGLNHNLNHSNSHSTRNEMCGIVYINYEGALEDESGNILVPDHPYMNEYYEYALKERILENLLMEDESVEKALGLVQQKLRGARNNALTVVNTPNFSEMAKMWETNRKAMYSKYYDMFSSYSPGSSPRFLHNNAV